MTFSPLLLDFSRLFSKFDLLKQYFESWNLEYEKMLFFVIF